MLKLLLVVGVLAVGAAVMWLVGDIRQFLRVTDASHEETLEDLAR